ncbi:MAG: ROK family protein [Planctomycetes bacterium]|nr:ROK family protein [Planctomycetota bacterium]
MPDSQETALGIDIGGGHCRAAVVDASGAILSFHTCKTPDQRDQFLDAIGNLARTAVDSTPTSRDTIGIALPGIVDPRSGTMRCAVNLPFLEGADVAALLHSALRRPVRIEIDVNAAAFAQWRRCRDRPRRFAYLSIGTGIGVGVVLDGQLVRHTDGGGGHWGHVPVDTSREAPVCRCGARGCLEAVAAGPAWDRTDSSATDSLEKRITALAIGCLQIAAVYAPDVIALGGGLIDHRPELVQTVAQRVNNLRGNVSPPSMAIERAVLSSDEAGVIGAALLCDPADRR